MQQLLWPGKRSQKTPILSRQPILCPAVTPSSKDTRTGCPFEGRQVTKFKQVQCGRLDCIQVPHTFQAKTLRCPFNRATHPSIVQRTAGLTWYPCQGSLPRRRNTSVYARDSRSSRRLPVLPRCACTLAYLTVPLQKHQQNMTQAAGASNTILERSNTQEEQEIGKKPRDIKTPSQVYSHLNTSGR